MTPCLVVSLVLYRLKIFSSKIYFKYLKRK